MLYRLNYGFEDLYQLKKKSVSEFNGLIEFCEKIILSTCLQSCTLFILAIRFIFEIVYWKELGAFVDHSLASQDWDYPLYEVCLVTFTEYIPIAAQTYALHLSTENDWKDL